MPGREPKEQTDTAGGRVWRTLLATAVGFGLFVGALLGVVGLRTSGFTLTLLPAQIPEILAVLIACYLAIGAAALLLSLRARRRERTPRSLEQPLFHLMATLTLWIAFTLMFLPLKGSEAFVRADTLTTLQLNVLGLAAVLIAGWLLGWLAARVLCVATSAARRRMSARTRLTLGAACAAVALAALGVGTAARVHAGASLTPPPGPVPRVAVVGVDGCDWEKLAPLVEAGRLPNFRRLMDAGVYGPLESLPPLVSPRIWTSIATGKTPDKHGIRDFVNEAGVPVNATMRTASTVWEIVSGFGQPVGVVGWYVTWPVDAVNGFLVSDRLHSLLRGPVQMFQSLTGRPTNERLESFGAFTFDPGYKRYPKDELRYQQNRIVDEPLRWGYLRDAIYTRVARALLPIYRPAFAAVYLRGVDFVQHFFWQYSDPEPFGGLPESDIIAYGGVIDSYYVYTDALLGRLMKALGDDVNIILVSDHGFKARVDNPDPKRPQLTGTHDLYGVFIASGPAFRTAGRFEGATILDITPTALAVMGLPIAEDMDGRALTEIITPEHLAARPLTSVPSYEPAVPRERGEVGSTMDESIREQLRSLGYIE